MDRYCYGCMNPLGEDSGCGHCGHEAQIRNDSHQLPAGTVLQNRFLIGKVLGQGGFGITYIGRDLLLETTVAVKEFYPHTLVTRDARQSLWVFCADDRTKEQFQRSRDRFLKEARTLVKLNEVSGIVHVQNVCLENNTAYIIMEYLEGVDLKQHLLRRNAPMTAQQTLAFFRPVLHALQKVHETGMIHRDISPDNIMVLRSGNVKLLDFGAARELERRENNPTFASELVVKQGFAPIEQYRENADLGPSVDIYALCASMYYCMTGQVPNTAPDRAMGSDNVDWKQIPGLTEKQTEALVRGLAVRAEDRFSRVEELWNCLYDNREPGAQKPDESKKVSVPGKSRKLPALIGAAVLLIAAAVGLWYLNGNPAEPEGKLEAQPTIPETVETAETPTPVTEAETEPPTETTLPPETEPEPAWKKNVLRPDDRIPDFRYQNKKTYEVELFEHYAGCPVMGSEITRGRITDVYFMDTLAEAPADAWDVSADQNRSVLAWTRKNNKSSLDLIIAGEGGVNGSQACNSLFFGYTELGSVHFDNCFFTEDTTDMSNMFAYCRRLSSVDMPALDTSNVVNMSGLFSGCESLRTLDLQQLDTSSVQNMASMFSGCTKLKELNLHSFDTSNVRDMSSMFSGCEALTVLDLSGFDTSRVTGMNSMFSGMIGMPAFDLSNFDTSQVTGMSYMFSRCTNIKMTTMDLSSFDTSGVTDMSGMFSGCTQLTTLDLSNFDTARVTNMGSMFSNCSRLMEVNLDSFDTSNVINMSSMFADCRLITKLSISHFNTPKVQRFDYMFYRCGRLAKVDVTDFDTSSLVSTSDMFYGCDKLDLQFKMIGGKHVWSR